MRTNKYRNEIIKFRDETLSSFVFKYDFFSYEEKSIPKDELVFLSYREFDKVVDDFFNDLVTYLKGTNRFNNLRLDNSFADCIIDFFKKASLKEGKIPEKIKNTYKSLEVMNSVEFDELIKLIKEIKLEYSKKYIKFYNKVRDELGKDLILENNIHICPYCKRNYINVVTNGNDKDFLIKPDLDHFYDKATYIFLAGTIDNLVPSCSVCNSKLKGTKDFKENKHLHPLIGDDLFDKVSFNFIGSNNTIYIDNKDELDVLSKSSLKTFKIEEVYNTHKEVLYNIKSKYRHYNRVKIKSLRSTVPFLSEYELEQTVFYEYNHLNKKKEPLYKMKSDLYKKIVKN